MIIRLDAYENDGTDKEEVILDLGQVMLMTLVSENETLDKVTFHFVNETQYTCFVTKDVYETLDGCFESTHP